METLGKILTNDTCENNCKNEKLLSSYKITVYRSCLNTFKTNKDNDSLIYNHGVYTIFCHYSYFNEHLMFSKLHNILTLSL